MVTLQLKLVWQTIQNEIVKGKSLMFSQQALQDPGPCIVWGYILKLPRNVYVSILLLNQFQIILFSDYVDSLSLSSIIMGRAGIIEDTIDEGNVEKAGAVNFCLFSVCFVVHIAG